MPLVKALSIIMTGTLRVVRMRARYRPVGPAPEMRIGGFGSFAILTVD